MDTQLHNPTIPIETILIVDDAPANLDILFKHLKLAGFKVLVAEDGESALDQARLAQPDAILLDIMMPQMDGFETCRRLKADPVTQAIPVIFMTALTDVQHKLKGFELGAVDYVTKPLELKEVLARLNTHITIRNLQARLQEKNALLQQEIAERKQAQAAEKRQRSALQKAHDEMEQRVEERTAELRLINEELKQEIQERRQAEQSLKRSQTRLTALNTATRVMASSLELKTVLSQAMAEIKTIVGVEGASVLLYDRDKNELSFAASVSPQAEHIIGQQIPLEDSIAGQVVREKEPVLVGDAQQHPRFYAGIDSLTGLTTQSLLAVPLIFRDKVIGVIEVVNKISGTFNQNDLELLEALASSAAIAIENARLFQAERTRYRETEALRRAGLVLASTIALDQVFESLLAELHHVVEYDSASVQIRKDKHLEIIGGRGFPDLANLLGTTLPVTGNSPNALVVVTHDPVIIDDVKTTEMSFDQTPDTATKIRSWMGVPLLFGDEVIGILALDKHQPNFYHARHSKTAMAYAAQAAIAIENARLYTETEKWAEQLAVIHELDQAITASLHLEDVYRAFARHTARLLPFDRMSIVLAQNDSLQVTYVVGAGAPPVGAEVSRQNSAVGWVFAQGQPLLRHNITKKPKFAEDEQLGQENIQSSMVIPLKIKKQVRGTWNIGSTKKGAYSPDDIEIAQLMADQLAIAIENAQLYQATEEQFRRLQESHTQLIQVEKMAAIGRLLASITHEINNPIQAIQNALTLIQEELAGLQRPDKLNLYTTITKTEIERIATIIRRMRNFYRPTPRRQEQPVSTEVAVDGYYELLPDELQPVALPDLIEEVLQLTNKQMQHKKVSVEQTWADDMPLVRGNPDQLKQVFLNLVLNAVDAMSGTGGLLRIKGQPAPAEERAGSQQGPMARLDFGDTGEGIPPDSLSHIFEPLFTTKSHGSGFGLFTSFKIIEAHKGRITVESRVNEGTTFTILLPLARSQP